MQKAELTSHANYVEGKTTLPVKTGQGAVEQGSRRDNQPRRETSPALIGLVRQRDRGLQQSTAFRARLDADNGQLSDEERRVLTEQAGRGERESAQAVEGLVRHGMEVARNIAFKFFRRGVDFDDAQSDANLGLVNAAKRFDPKKGEFFPYIIRTIEGEVRRGKRDRHDASPIRPPNEIRDVIAKIFEARTILTQRLGHYPNVHEIAEDSGVSSKIVHTVLHDRLLKSPHSFDEKLPENALWEDVIDDGQRPISDVVAEAIDLKRAFASLSERERGILIARMSGDLQGKIAERVGVSQMEISRILARTFKRLEKDTEASEVVVHKPIPQELKLTEQRQLVLKILSENPGSSTSQLVEHAGGIIKNRAEAWLVVNSMANAGLVSITGKGAKARYSRAKQSDKPSVGKDKAAKDKGPSIAKKTDGNEPAAKVVDLTERYLRRGEEVRDEEAQPAAEQDIASLYGFRGSEVEQRVPETFERRRVIYPEALEASD